MESFSGPFISILYLAVLTALVLSIRQYRRVRRLPWPPGPPGLPVLGNLFDIPKSQRWVHFRSLCAIYGDVLHFRVFNSSFIVLGSADVIQECLEKRSAITSDRPHSHMFELTGNDFNLGFMPYGDGWRRHRRAFWQYFRPQAGIEYRAVQRAMAGKFLRKVLQTPNELKEHLRYSFSATLLKILYDIDATDENDEWIKKVEKALEGALESTVPGAFLVEFLPFLQYVPAFVPGAGFQKKFAEWREASDDLKVAPVTRVKLSMERGEVAPSVTARLLEGIYRTDVEGAKLAEEEEIVGNVGAVAFEAGSDTTFSTLKTVFLAMSLYPDVLKKAHAELDAVVGPNRLPDFDDEKSLVYVSAIIKEAQRWIPAVPTGVPHGTTEDLELRGYLIPAGTVLMPNIWACMHDPEVFEDPETFRPERYIKDGALDPSVRDPAAFTFGFGRRICPGRYFAEAAMFINVAAALHVFDISPPLDERGNVIRNVPKMTDGIISHPEDCRCTIKPRSASAEALILAQAASDDSPVA
ncbi:cytochrome P450 [Fomes fomentarius]|nr:cytochrome P450 [Fomes fomentarius]